MADSADEVDNGISQHSSFSSSASSALSSPQSSPGSSPRAASMSSVESKRHTDGRLSPLEVATAALQIMQLNDDNKDELTDATAAAAAVAAPSAGLLEEVKQESHAELAHSDDRDDVINSKGPVGGTTESCTEGTEKDERLLVERNGKFVFMKISDLTAEEKDLYSTEPVAGAVRRKTCQVASKSECLLARGAKTTERRITERCNKTSSATSFDVTPKATSTNPRHVRRDVNKPAWRTGHVTALTGNTCASNVAQKASISDKCNNEDGEVSGCNIISVPKMPHQQKPYQSPYAMSEEDRLEFARRKIDFNMQQRMALKKKQEEDEDKKIRSDQAFSDWLKNKRYTGKQGKELNQKTAADSRYRPDNSENEAAFNAWLRMKKYETELKERQILMRRKRLLQNCQHQYQQQHPPERKRGSSRRDRQRVIAERRLSDIAQTYGMKKMINNNGGLHRPRLHGVSTTML